MKTIIAGSRSITDWQVLARAIELCPWEITAVVSGNAVGIDQLGEDYARDLGLPLEVYPALWKQHGSKAGLYRNEEMLGKAKHLLAVWDGNSSGTRHMISIAKRDGAEVFVYEYDLEKGKEAGRDHYFARKVGNTPQPLAPPTKSHRTRR